jgi:hypothetical protein
MSLLHRGTETVTVYPEEVVTDAEARNLMMGVNNEKLVAKPPRGGGH